MRHLKHLPTDPSEKSPISIFSSPFRWPWPKSSMGGCGDCTKILRGSILEIVKPVVQLEKCSP